MAESPLTSQAALAEQILSDPEFQSLTRRKASLSLVLTLVTMVCYAAFVLSLALGAPYLARPVDGATLGIPIGVGLIFLGWIVTGIYVRWANDSYDRSVAELRARYFSTRTEA